MATFFTENTVRFEGIVYEDEIIVLRDYLQNIAPSELSFDFSVCDDIHLGALQLVLAYKKLYECSYFFGNEKKIYQKVCEGFETSDEFCV